MKLEGSWADLRTRGFVVVRSFLSPQQIASFTADYAKVAQQPSKLAAYYTGVVSPHVAKPLAEQIESLLPIIQRESGNLANVISYVGLYFPTSRTELFWHIDTLSYFVRQDHYHMLNFWIPIIKPDPQRSGLSLIPMDKLAERAPKVHEMIVGRGAARFLSDRVISERDGRVVETLSPVGPDELAETPAMSPGDAIVVRGDLFHKTQDVDTDRVAISIRAFNNNQILDKRTLLTMSQCKYERMLLERSIFVPLLLSFWKLHKDQITQREHEELMRAAKPTLATKAVNALYPYLLWYHRQRSQRRKTAFDDRISRERLADHYRSRESTR